jgi:hypothetical protein
MYGRMDILKRCIVTLHDFEQDIIPRPQNTRKKDKAA